MAPIPFPQTSMPGAHPQESAGRLINAYAEALGAGARWPAVCRRVAGLTTWGESAATGAFRGMISTSSNLYAVWEDIAYSFSSAGGSGSPIGTLLGDKKCFFAKNNATTPDIVVVDPDNGASILTGGAVGAYPDVDVAQPNSVCFLDGYFFFTYGSGLCRASGINTTAINALDFTTADMKPDTLLRAIPWNSQLLLFGTESTEFWSGNPPNDTGFPFNRVTAKPRGLHGRNAVTGWEDGFGSALIIVGNDDAVHMLQGYEWAKISPPDLDRLISRVEDIDEIEAGCYTQEGRTKVAISSATWTWEFCLNTMKWNERQSYLQNRWRGTQPHRAFEKWLIGDTEAAHIREITVNARNEIGDPLIARIESGPVAKFPERARIPRIEIDVTRGIGVATGDEPNQTDPRIEISVSRDGGYTWDMPRLVPMGRQAITDQRVYATRFGISSVAGPRVRVDISDEVDFGVFGGEIFGEPRSG